MPDPIAQFANAGYLNLETFRKNGAGVRTPVWFAEDTGLPPEIAQAQEGLQPSPVSRGGSKNDGTVFYVYSEADAGKVKRIRNNPKVRIAPCNFRGKLRGAWVEARARLCDRQEEIQHAQDLLRCKYGLLKIVGDFFSRLRRHQQAVIAIELD